MFNLEEYVLVAKWEDRNNGRYARVSEVVLEYNIVSKMDVV